MDELIVQRLASFGYIVTDDDTWVIGFCKDMVENHIKNTCNITSIPEGLVEIAVDRVCGEFLFVKKQTGQLDTTFNIEMAVKSVQAGDTNVSFETTQSPETRFDTLTSYLQSRGEGDLISYRKIRW